MALLLRDEHCRLNAAAATGGSILLEALHLLLTEICRRLDGLPLAIELAAARVKALPVSVMLSRMEQRLPLLTGSRRDSPERQRTMRNAIAWSYEQLTPSEQMLYRRLGVFVGGFTLESAEEVAGAGTEILIDLESLVDKSLVRLETGNADGSRYLMLETIREFALEQLMASDNHDEIRTAHAAWCTALGEEWRRYGDTRHQPEMAGRAEPPLEVEFDNVRAAMTWLNQSGKVEGLARLAGAVWYYWVLHGPRTEGLFWLERASSIDANSAFNKTSKLWVMQGISEHAQNLGRSEQAVSAVNECLVLARELNDPLSEATALAMVAYIAADDGEYDRAETFIQEAIGLNERIGHWRAVATDRLLLAISAYGRGELDQAVQILQSIVEVHRTSGDMVDEAWERNWLALIRNDQGRQQEAAEVLAEALLIWRSVNNQEGLAECLSTASAIATGCGSFSLGTRLWSAASARSAALGFPFSPLRRAALEKTEQAQRAALDHDEFASAWKSGSELPFQQAIAEAAAFLDRLLEPVTATEPGQSLNPFGLTARELDVLRLLAEGKSDREIAEALFIGLRTVETHVSNLLAKLGARNRAEAAALAVRQGIA
jgi:non-specific serine/threonine protein kinase